MALTWTYDPSTLIGKVRLNLQDNRGEIATGASFVFADEELQHYLDQQNDNVRLASADALVAMATNQLLLLKMLKIGTLGTDGQAVAETLLTLAANYREQALAASVDPTATDWDWATFGCVERCR